MCVSIWSPCQLYAGSHLWLVWPLHGSPFHTFHTQFEVWLSKEPSGVGFSITSGRDTAGSSRPGDKVSPFYGRHCVSHLHNLAYGTCQG